MSADAVRAFRDRFALPVSDAQLDELPYLKPEPGSAEGTLLRRTPCRTRRPRAGPLQQRGAAAGAAARRVRRSAQGQRRARAVDHDGVRAHPRHAAEGSGTRQARRADRAGRVAHVRDGGPVPPDRHPLASRPALYAAGRRPAQLLQGKRRTGRSCRKASTNRARSRRGSRPAPRTATTACRRFRSTSSIRCSGCNASATSRGQPATHVRAASCSARRRAARR